MEQTPTFRRVHVVINPASGKDQPILRSHRVMRVDWPGLSAEDAMATVKAGRALADPDAAHIRSRIVQFEALWRSA
jgi:hypothetical protein